ncbi:hypothetical protein [Govanella unica]|uniref:Uncharacterized protein n=1 Tax=Govanella unica TaxID=2975056 RepID=A0A9X3Z5Z6_9PROT|nr:hypothetical protein [Govania unica]MDA5192616.1 hypothetical protein [Govania unica]
MSPDQNQPSPVSSTEEVAIIAAAFLDLWQRNMAAWATDPQSGPPLALVENLARQWISTNKIPKTGTS